MISDPVPTEVQPFRVCFVCAGNICRSPMAEVVFQSMVRQAGLTRLHEDVGIWGGSVRQSHRIRRHASIIGLSHYLNARLRLRLLRCRLLHSQ